MLYLVGLPSHKNEQQRLITFGRQEALVLAGGKRVTITVQASQREHALITTNPVERAEHTSMIPEQSSSRLRPVDAHTQVSGESHDLPLSLQQTVPLHLLREEESDTVTLKMRTNNHRQPEQQTKA